MGQPLSKRIPISCNRPPSKSTIEVADVCLTRRFISAVAAISGWITLSIPNRSGRISDPFSEYSVFLSRAMILLAPSSWESCEAIRFTSSTRVTATTISAFSTSASRSISGLAPSPRTVITSRFSDARCTLSLEISIMVISKSSSLSPLES